MNKLLNLAFGIMAIGVFALSTQVFSAPRTTQAALDCDNTALLRVEIVDEGRPNVNGGLLNYPGAYVVFSDNIQTGGLESVTYSDNGVNDDERDRYGVIEERTACTPDDTVGLRVELRFRDTLDCTVIGDPSKDVDFYEDAVVEFVVDDCERVVPTATATSVPATATPVPATPTIQPVQPTVQIVVQCADGSLVINKACPTVAPAATQPPVVPTAVSVTTPRITAPSTGSAGLLSK